MKDMVITTEEKKDRQEHSIVCDVPKYPYGLKLHFDHESFKKLGMAEPPKVGTKMMVMAYAEVCGVDQQKYEGDVPKISMGLQIMEVELKEKEENRSEDGEKRDVASELYA